MRAGITSLMILAAALPCAVANELAGTWEGKFTRGTTSFSAGFDLDVTGDRITGMAFVEGWGVAPVSDGHVEGDRFRFTINLRDGPSKVECEGAVTGKTMALTMDSSTRYESTMHRVESEVTEPLSANASPKELEGEWTARFVGRIGDRPKMIGRVDFTFHVDGNTLTGLAHMSAWPGDCRISDGKVENGKFSFLATGSIPSSSGIPVTRFEGEIHGKQLTLTMQPQISGANHGKKLPMDATRMLP